MNLYVSFEEMKSDLPWVTRRMPDLKMYRPPRVTMKAGTEPDGQVDAPRHDHEDHAAGHDGDDRHLGKDVLDVVRGPEVRRRDPEPDPDGHQGHDQDVGPEIPGEESEQDVRDLRHAYPTAISTPVARAMIFS